MIPGTPFSCLLATQIKVAIMIGKYRGCPTRAALRPCILLALLLASFSAAAWSQTQLATVFGTITDPAGAVIPEARITVSSASTGLKRVALTDINGQYHVAGLPPGMYAIRTEKEKFQTQVLEGIALSSGAAIAVNLSLRVGTVPQEVIVDADVAIDITTSTVSGASP